MHLGVAPVWPDPEGMTTTHLEPEIGSTTNRRGVLATLARRWPTALAVAMSVTSFTGQVTADSIHGLAQALPLLPLLYVLVFLLRRQRASWPVLVALLLSFVALGLQDWVAPEIVVLAVALAAAIWGAGHGRHRERGFWVQLAGMAGFAAISMAALAVDPDLGRYLVAAGWFAHGIWDFVHLAKNRVVSRSYAEWCGVVDVLVAASLIIVPLL